MLHALALLSLMFVQDDSDRRAEMLKKRLKLTDEQAEKVKEIYKSSKEAQEKADQERRDKVRELLDDDQKKTFDEMGKGGAVERRGWERGGADAEEMKKAMEEARKQMEELKEKGFKGLEEFKGFDDGGDEGKGFKVFRMGGEAPAQSPEQRVKGAMGALKIEDEKEADAIKGLLKTVVEAQAALESFEKEAKKTVDGLLADNASDEAIEKKLGDVRTQRKEKTDAVRAAQKELSGVVSYRQELELIKRGILK